MSSYFNQAAIFTQTTFFSEHEVILTQALICPQPQPSRFWCCHPLKAGCQYLRVGTLSNF